jgi:toxin ParE1/3/4
MPRPRYTLSRQAQLDLDAIALYLADQSRGAARRVLTELRNTFQLLAANPGIGTRRDDLYFEVRSFSPSRPAANNVIFFYPRSYGVEISDVIHAAQNWEDMFERGDR